MVEIPTISDAARTSYSILRRSSTKSSTSQPRFFIIVPRMSVPKRGRGNWLKMWRFGACGSMKTILGIASFLGFFPPFTILSLDGQDVLSFLLEEVLPAFDALLEELHLVEKPL